MSIRVLITGITGQIGKYVKEVFESNELYDVYGISRTSSSNSKVKEMDLKDKMSLEKYILELQPAIIIHLAGMSNLEECAADPINAIEINGHVTVNICEIIHRNKLNCKLFNASSSEIYKGHNTYIVTENDRFYMPNHPYGISKLVAHNMIDYYRMIHKLPFSNGIIFTTESHRRTPAFLFKKVANHIKSWKNGNREILTVGCLKSFRTLLHAHDVAYAIKYIIEHDRGDNYIICGDIHISVESVIRRMFELANIPIIMSDTEIRCSNSNTLIVRISGSLRGAVSSIHGECKKIKELGWKASYDIDAICRDHLA